MQENWLALYLCIFENIPIDEAIIYVEINKRLKNKNLVNQINKPKYYVQ